MQAIGLIPARWASSRFPGKPLAQIGGKPMIQRVYEQARKALDTVVVATDDSRIFDCVTAFGGQAVMTRSDHRCGTERCLEAYETILAHPEAYGLTPQAVSNEQDIVVVNVQGDEPFIQPEQIRLLLGCFPAEIATLVKPFRANDTWEQLANPNTPKVAVSKDGRALLFSRSVIPYFRGVPQDEWLGRTQYYGHIGMYAYRGDVLRQIVSLPMSELERTESLEQLRWLDNGYTIRVAVSEQSSVGIDTPEDLQRAEQFLQKHLNTLH